MNWSGTPPGTSLAGPAPTPTTRCCRRRSRRGRCRSSSDPAAAPADHLPDQPRVSRRDVGALPAGHRPPPAHVADRRGQRADACAWRTWRWSAATRSTASRNCTRELMQQTIFRDFAEMWPEPLHQCHQRHRRAALVEAGQSRARRADHRASRGRLGERPRGTGAAAMRGRRCRSSASDSRRSRRRTRCASPRRIQRLIGIEVDSASLFDVQVKRIHEYKRQLLNLLYVIDALQPHPRQPGRCRSCRAPSSSPARPRPATRWPKTIIKLINNVARVINNDPRRRRQTEGVLSARLRRVAGAANHARLRTCRSRSRRRAWKPRARAT